MLRSTMVVGNPTYQSHVSSYHQSSCVMAMNQGKCTNVTSPGTQDDEDGAEHHPFQHGYTFRNAYHLMIPH